jgi:HD-like signal output (HDOD) protein/CheY-like chemotaxis protein
MNNKKRILIVDDEVVVLQALHRLLIGMNQQWHMEFTDSAAKALQILSKMSFDVVVADLFMPGMDGTQLLHEVMIKYPQTTRIVMCWQAEQNALRKSFSVAHQFLFKPCESEVLLNMLARAVSQSDRLINERVKKLISQMRTVPSLPSLYVELMREMRTEDPSLQKAGQIIAKDPGMSAKILQLVNSAFFGLPWKVNNPIEATVYLGLETVKALVLSLQVFSMFDRMNIKAFGFERLWMHSWECGILAKRICTSERRDLGLAEHAFVTGLLHDIGKLVLACNLPEPYREAVKQAATDRIPLWQAENKVFSCSHAEVGGYLLSLWGLANPIVEGVTYHHTPSESLNRSLGPVIAVHVANALDHEYHHDGPEQEFGGVDLDYILALGLGEHFSTWRDACSAMFEQKNDEGVPANAPA